jgi:hypothetical protein
LEPIAVRDLHDRFAERPIVTEEDGGADHAFVPDGRDFRDSAIVHDLRQRARAAARKEYVLNTLILLMQHLFERERNHRQTGRDALIVVCGQRGE